MQNIFLRSKSYILNYKRNIINDLFVYIIVLKH